MKTTILLMTTAAMACELRVLTYNIHHAEGVDGKLDVPRIGRVIRDARPDIVSLQEVDVRTERVKGRDTVRELERLTGLRGVFGQSMPFQGGGYGNGVLVSGQLLGSRVFPIPNSPNMEPRSLLLVETRPYRCAQDVAFIATHLDHRSETDRIAGADMANLPVSLPAILAGDLNTTADSPVFGVLMKEWANASNAEQPTIPVKDPKKQIDFVLFRPKNQWKVIETRVLDEDVASDHRALLAVLRLLPAQ
ncbi:MAG: endonuclease [Acidobacteria bacterium]|nr:endonuclease [Acidobacteriota bacterium]